MSLLRDKNTAQTFLWWRVVLFFMVLVIFGSFLALGQQPVMFQYGEPFFVDQAWKDANEPVELNIPKIGEEKITCLGDFHDSSRDEFLPRLKLSSSGHDPDVTGRCLYNNPVNLIEPCLSFYQSIGTMFQVQMTYPVKDFGQLGLFQGLAFIVTSDTSTQGEGGGYLGWLSSSTSGQAYRGLKNFAVEIDLFPNVQFQDPAYAHIGVDSNSLISVETSRIDIPSFIIQSFPESTDFSKCVFTVWIEFDLSDDSVDVYIGNIYKKPLVPIISTKFNISLAKIFSQDTFVGFSGSISNVSIPSRMDYKILFWTFNSNGPAPDLQRYQDGTVLDRRDGEMARQIPLTVAALYLPVPAVLVFVILVYIIWTLSIRNARLAALAAIATTYDIDESLLGQGAKKFEYNALFTATKGFSYDQLLGTGGFGSVYMGKLPRAVKGDEKPTAIAVKRISGTSKQGASEFLAEVKIIGQAQHRNLVRLLGWCHGRGELLLVYEYMPNGSVDQHLHKSTLGEPVLTWSRRLKIMSGVATALAFLHEEWEQRVIHRDVKCSNIMLDINFNARLGDFGLARSSEHDKELLCTSVAGTRGYLAPELGITFLPTEKTDVYSFGAVVLEVATGKKPILSREDKESLKQIFLVDWVWDLYRDDVLLDAADSTLHNAYDPREMIMFLKIGLLCCHPNPDERPTMRNVISIWKGSSPFPPLPRSIPVPVFPLNPAGPVVSCSWDDTTATDTSTDTHGGLADELGTGTMALDRDGHSAIAIPSEDDVDCPSSQKIEREKGGSSNLTARHRARTATSLPF